ncbi:MAG: HDIG domain-containing protein [Bacteroidetes bacterium]|nr:HDIG domain-containing protein [Bacteroidota bacterium]
MKWKVRNQYANIYKIFLFVVSIFLLVWLFPREGTFKYEFRKGKYWMHEDLIAPFDFAITKSEEEMLAEKAALLKNVKPYFRIDILLNLQKRNDFKSILYKKWDENRGLEKNEHNNKNHILSSIINIYDSLINTGIIELIPEIENKPTDFVIVLLKNNIAEEKEINKFYTIKLADIYIRSEVDKLHLRDATFFISIIENSLFQNVKYDQLTTENEKQNLIANISSAKGMVENGQRIISKGELITADKYQILQSLKKEHETQLGSSSKYYLILLGQIILLSISIIVLVLFLQAFRKDILADNKKNLFLLLVIFIMVFITSIVIKTDANYIYLVPLCLVPIIIRVFFDTRLALFVHLVTIIIIGFLAPNSFDFVFIQMIAGIIAIISVINLEKRAQFFISSFFIFVTYSLIYIGLILLQDGKFNQESYKVFVMFAGSAMLTLFSYPLIFVFEKLFGYVTDVSLMELSNTNSKLLREMASKTPGTFQHSLQIANLVEEVIFEIGGNALLARAGALYHDIGKMEMPMYFIENQATGINPHNELSYDESAEIIISHVSKGIKIARKNNIPEQLIDFIRTHHGTRKTTFFYQKFKADFPDEKVDESIYSYKGPIPFSKETAVLMIVDSVEAASRSIKFPDEQKINDLVENIVNEQISSKQFLNSDITFRDIDKIKGILKKKLANIYHTRIEYPII